MKYGWSLPRHSIRSCARPVRSCQPAVATVIATVGLLGRPHIYINWNLVLFEEPRRTSRVQPTLQTISIKVWTKAIGPELEKIWEESRWGLRIWWSVRIWHGHVLQAPSRPETARLWCFRSPVGPPSAAGWSGLEVTITNDELCKLLWLFSNKRSKEFPFFQQQLTFVEFRKEDRSRRGQEYSSTWRRI